MIHPRMATMLVGRADRRGRRRPRRSGACSGRRRRGPGTSCRSTATRAPTTPSSSWPRGRRGPRRWGPAPRPPTSSAAPSRRSRATSPASRRPTARARATLITAAVTGARDDADARAVARAVVSSSLVKAAAHGRDPNWGRIAGAAGNARLADARRPRGGRPARRRRRRPVPARPAVLDPATLRIAIAGHLVFDGAAGRPGRLRSGGGARGDGGARRSSSALDLGLGDGARRGLRLRPDRGVRHRELGVHDVSEILGRQAGRDDDRRPVPGARRKWPRSRGDVPWSWSTAAASASPSGSSASACRASSRAACA